MRYVAEGQFPEIVKCCKKVLTMFGSTYVCKAGFLAMNNIKSKKRNSLTDEHLENLLRAAVTQYRVSGRSGLAVACLTAVREVLGSNRAVGSCVYRTTTDLQPWARAVCTFPAVPRSTQPSTQRGTVNEYQLSG